MPPSVSCAPQPIAVRVSVVDLEDGSTVVTVGAEPVAVTLEVDAGIR